MQHLSKGNDNQQSFRFVASEGWNQHSLGEATTLIWTRWFSPRDPSWLLHSVLIRCLFLFRFAPLAISPRLSLWSVSPSVSCSLVVHELAPPVVGCSLPQPPWLHVSSSGSSAPPPACSRHPPPGLGCLSLCLSVCFLSLSASLALSLSLSLSLPPSPPVAPPLAIGISLNATFCRGGVVIT